MVIDGAGCPWLDSHLGCGNRTGRTWAEFVRWRFGEARRAESGMTPMDLALVAGLQASRGVRVELMGERTNNRT